jgi:hypothetical protein
MLQARLLDTAPSHPAIQLGLNDHLKMAGILRAKRHLDPSEHDLDISRILLQGAVGQIIHLLLHLAFPFQHGLELGQIADPLEADPEALWDLLGGEEQGVGGVRGLEILVDF